MTSRCTTWSALLLLSIFLPTTASALLTTGDTVVVNFDAATDIDGFVILRDDVPDLANLGIAQNAAKGVGTPASGGVEAINIGSLNQQNDMAVLYSPGGTTSTTAHISLNASDTVTLTVKFKTFTAVELATPRLGIASAAHVNAATTNGTVLNLDDAKDIIGGANQWADNMAVNILTGGDKHFSIMNVLAGVGRTEFRDPAGPYPLTDATWYQLVADITKSATPDVFDVSAVFNLLNADGTALDSQIGSVSATITNAGVYAGNVIAGFTFVHDGETPPDTVSNEYDDFTIQVKAFVPSPPEILDPPQDQDVVLGDDVTLNVTADGTPPLAYQWRLGGAPIAGETNTFLSITNAGEGAAGPYSVTVTNAFGSTNSTDATLSYIGPDLVPAGQVVFQLNAFGIAPVLPDGPGRSYQWRQDGSDLGGETNQTLQIGSASLADDGEYDLVYSLGGNTVTSSIAEVIVPLEPTDAYSTIVTGDMPRAYWRLGEGAGATVAAEEIALVAVGGLVGDYGTNTEAGATGVLLGDTDTALRCLGDTNSVVEVAGGSDTLSTLAIAAPFSVEIWALAEGGQGTFRSPFAYVDWVNATVIDGWTFFANNQNQWEFRTGEGSVNTPDTTAWNIISGSPVVIGEWAHLVGVHDGTDMKFYVNGILAGTITGAVFNPVSYFLVPCTIGAGSALDGGGDTTGDYWIGKVDEPAFYGTALTASQVVEHYAAAFPLDTPPVIDTQPADLAVLETVTADFFVAAHGVTPSTYQWLYNGGVLPGETNDTLQIAGTLTTDAGNYAVIVSNNGGSVTSDVAVLTVYDDAVGTSLSVSFIAFSNPGELISANGGNAGFVNSSNWMEIADETPNSTEPVGDMLDDRDALTGITLTWSAKTGRRGGWTNLVNGSHAMLTGFLESRNVFGDTNDVVITLVISNIPPAYTEVGYDVIAYMGAPAAGNAGRYDASPTNFTAGISDGNRTFYYHGLDGRSWDGTNWVQATTTDPGILPPDANYAEFNVLSGSTATLTVDAHPLLLEGPATLSGFQILPGRSSALTIDNVGGAVTVDWTGVGVLQSATDLPLDNWGDVAGGTVTSGPYQVTTPQAVESFRLRGP